MKKTTLITIFIFLMLILVTTVAFASEYIFVQNYRTLAGVTVAYPQLGIRVTPVTPGQTWRGEIKSFTGNPVYNIDRIGWNWWTMRQYCGDVNQQQYQFGGGTLYNTNTNSLYKSRALVSCPQGVTRYVSVLAKHDFSEANDVHQPVWESPKKQAP